MLDEMNLSSKYWLKPELFLTISGSVGCDSGPELCGMRGPLDIEVDICPSIRLHHSSSVEASHNLSLDISGRPGAGVLMKGAVSNSSDISASWIYSAEANLGMD